MPTTWGDREALEWRQAAMWAEEAREIEAGGRSAARACWAQCVTALLCALLGGE